MTLREYQVLPVDFLVQRQFGLIHAPAGSGKTIIGASSVARMIEKGGSCQVVWIANTIEQCAQATAALTACLGYDAKRSVQVCCAASKPDLSRASIVVVDEAHHSPAGGWTETLSAAPKDCRIWGLTATPWSTDDERNQVMRDIFKEFFEVKREALVEHGQLAKAIVKILHVNRVNELVNAIEVEAEPEIQRRLARYRFIDPSVQRNRVLWQVCQQIGIVMNRERNREAIRVSTEHVLHEDTVLVLVNQVVHAEMLAEQIPGAIAVFSGMGLKKRKAALTGFANGTVPCVVATSLADEGLDVPRANVLVLVSAGRSSNKLEQRTGRVLRSFAGKTHGMIYDFDDLGHYFLSAQAKARMRVYRNLGYEILL